MWNKAPATPKRTYKDAINLTLQKEGGYVNDPHDRGGETNKGIAKKFYPNEDIKNMTDERATEIYKKDYFDKVSGDKMPLPLATNVFDMAVNSGIRSAAKLLQITVGAKPDGVIGAKTLKAAEEAYKADPKGTLDKYRDARIEHYKKLKQYDRYGRGWTNRAVQVNEVAKQWIEEA
jgi:lysozyme family protein